MENKSKYNNEQNAAIDQGNVSGSINLRDLYSLCLQKWRWFVVSVLVCLFLASYHLLTTQNVYTRFASVMIKDESQSRSRSFASQLSNMGNMGMFSSASNANNELVAFQSPSLLLDVVKRMHLDYNYSKSGLFHDVVLSGKNLPVTAEIGGLNERQSVSFKLKLDGNKVEVSNLVSVSGKEKIKTDEVYKGQINSTINTAAGAIIVKATPYYNPADGIQEIKVVRIPLLKAVAKCQSSLSANLQDKMSDIISFSYNDVDVQRAEDFLNTLITAYNETWVKDKNQIAVSTSEFINERLKVIEQELGHVDNNISAFKSQNLTPDLAQSTALAMQQATQSDNKAREYSNQLYMARYVKSELQKEGSKHKLMPANTGIGDAAAERMLASYNDMVLKRNSLAANSSENNPLVQDIDTQLASLKSSIITTLNNDITHLTALANSEQGNAAQNTGKIAQSPVQAKNLLSVERQQKV